MRYQFDISKRISKNKATRLVSILRKKEYEKKLNKLKLTTIEIRRKEVEGLIKFYKIKNGFGQVRKIVLMKLKYGTKKL